MIDKNASFRALLAAPLRSCQASADPYSRSLASILEPLYKPVGLYEPGRHDKSDTMAQLLTRVFRDPSLLGINAMTGNSTNLQESSSGQVVSSTSETSADTHSSEHLRD